MFLQRKPEKRSHDIKFKRTPYWKRTKDFEGHKPKFEIECKICGMPMALRHSTLSNDDKDPTKTSMEYNYLCYKCPRCAWFIRFDVRDTKKYLMGIFEKRNGNNMFIPATDDWSRESDEIKKRLEALGYW